MNLLSRIDNTWTLFLDRDGVINEEKVADYILDWQHFRFYEGATSAIQTLSAIFGTVVVVTNQRGIGKGLMTVTDLENIHQNMVASITNVSGRIDKIYYCSELDDNCVNRKPNPGMAYQAQQDFPHINLGKSVMVGNKPSDMRFGRNAGMFTVYIASTNPETPFPHPDIDLRFSSLKAFADALHTAITKP